MEDPSSWRNVLPLLMLIWRLTIPLDAVTAAIQFTVPVLPPTPMNTNHCHRLWAMSLTKDLRNVDMALALFALDDLFHRLRHWAVECHVFMTSPDYLNNSDVRKVYNTISEQRLASLWKEHQIWIEQPICALVMQLELYAQIRANKLSTADLLKFLDYPPIVIYDHNFMFMLMLNAW
jgi:hypothetical protein